LADYSVSISNSINCFGPAPSTKWGVGSVYTMTWGVSKWGEGTIDLETHTERTITMQSLTFGGGLMSLEPIKVLSNTFDFTSETTSEDLRTANGYYYQFTRPTTDAESRNQSTYTTGSAGSTLYTSGSAASTPWSEA
jgi:hypothetical protein